MFIGSLADKRSMITGTYSYTKRGVNVPAFPDLYPDSINGKISIGSGNLFNGKKVGWKWTTLLDVGIDIKFELDKASFIDRVLIRQESGSGFGSVEILTGLGSSNLNAAGRLDAPTEQILDNNEITVQVGETADKVVIRLNSYFKNIIIESVDIIGAVFDTPVIYPIPNSIDINNDVSIKTEDLKYIIIRKR